ncbi:MAG: hypothetical protein ACRENP_05620 [Longimicrobiales bacterium]
MQLHNFWRITARATLHRRAQSDDLTRGGPLMGTASAHALSASISGRPSPMPGIFLVAILCVPAEHDDAAVQCGGGRAEDGARSFHGEQTPAFTVPGPCVGEGHAIRRTHAAVHDHVLRLCIVGHDVPGSAGRTRHIERVHRSYIVNATGRNVQDQPLAMLRARFA